VITEILKKLITKENLSAEEASYFMTSIMSGEAGEIRTAALLAALASKGETPLEIESFARSMRRAAVSWPGKSPEVLLDTCGTGGDSSNTINISTLTAILLASMGYPVAKHGNRAVSSSTGSADMLEEAGISMDLTHEEIADCLASVGITFLFAPKWHPAMKHAAPVRKALGVRTVFNILGPLTNPAPVSHQIVGIFSDQFMQSYAGALAGLGRKGAYVVHSKDGLDELSIAAPTNFIKIEKGKIGSSGVFHPSDFGFELYDLTLLQAKDREESILRFHNILAGKGSNAENSMIAMNAALAISLVEESQQYKSIAAKCNDHLKSGMCADLLLKWTHYRREGNVVMSTGDL